MSEVLRPPALEAGATIGVAAISGPVEPGRLDDGLASLRRRGYRIREAENLRDRNGLFAGDDRARARGYLALLEDQSVDAIFFARGGSGASRVVALIDPAAATRHPKIHLGASDVTALFAHRAGYGLASFYGPMVAVEMATEEGLDWEGVLAGETPEPHRFQASEVLAPGSAEGTLAGGCLSLLASLAGTPEAARGSGAVLFWEDVGEEIYRIDRMLTQLERSGTFDRLQAMLIGSVVSRDRTETPETVRDYLRSRFSGAPFPVAMGLPAGHLARPRTLPLGARVSLDLGERLELTFAGPAVRPS